LGGPDIVRTMLDGVNKRTYLEGNSDKWACDEAGAAALPTTPKCPLMALPRSAGVSAQCPRSRVTQTFTGGAPKD
jgi:hypothetical protein